MRIFILEHNTEYEDCSYVIKAFELKEDAVQYMKDNYKEFYEDTGKDVWENGSCYITLSSTELVRNSK